MTVIAAIERTREYEHMFVYRSIDKFIDKLFQEGLKHADQVYDDNHFLAKCRMSVRDEKKESKQPGQPYVYFLIFLTWLMLINSQPAQLILLPMNLIQILSPP